MNQKQLETFVAAVRSESFLTPTGDHHRYATSAAPEILELEEELGVLLFIREGLNTGILTEAGQLFAVDAERILHDMRVARRRIDRYLPDDTRTVCIGTLPFLRQYRLNRVFTRFTEDHPEARFVMEQNDGKQLVDGLKSGYYDGVVLRKNMVNSKGLETIRLASDEIAAIVWEGHPLADEPSIELSDLKNEYFFLAPPSSPSYGICRKLLIDRHISTENVHTAPIEQILKAAAENRGVALLPISNLIVYEQTDTVPVPLLPKAVVEVVFAYKKDAERCSLMSELIRVLESRARAVPRL
ncbi:MAG: LysR family transcriptional regulator substrate-binding protein [Solobacterium sp.]|nr:LysR family transcriptional regulator substrate-binding protein [Solobacterium sp.]